MQTLPTPTETGYTRLAAFVHVFDNVFSTDFCNNIIKEYKEIDFVDAVDHGAGYRQCMGAKILNNADKKRKEIDNSKILFYKDIQNQLSGKGNLTTIRPLQSLPNQL